MNDELTKLEWSILNSLANDGEAVTLMMGLIEFDFPGIMQKISQREIAEIVYTLYQRELLSEFYNKKVDYQTLINETSDYVDAAYWFGLTEAGYKCWEEYAPVYLGESIDWSDSWHADLNFEHQDGWIKGVSKEVCLENLEGIDKDNNWQIDRTTLVHSKIKGFQAKYYKYIQGGHQITFKLKKR
jgi:hypothetical protein